MSDLWNDDPKSDSTVIDIKNLSLTFKTSDGDVNALNDIDLRVGHGDFVSFIGPSGCGKTTLLRVIADLSALRLSVISDRYRRLLGNSDFLTH